MMESTAGEAVDLSDSEMLRGLYRAALADVFPPETRRWFRPAGMQVDVLQWLSADTIAPIRFEVAVLAVGVRVILTAPDGSRLWERLILFADAKL